MFKVYCFVLAAAYAYVSFSGKTFFTLNEKRKMTAPGQRHISHK